MGANGTSIVLRCTKCNAANRVPAARIVDRPVCGKCGAPLPPPAEPITLDDASFDRVIERAELPVLVDFWATWCGPCRAFAPTLAAYAKERAGKVLVAKLDVDRAPRTASRFGIRAVPTLMVFRNGRKVEEAAGVLAPQALDRLVGIG